jgi:hypothetical protein
MRSGISWNLRGKQPVGSLKSTPVLPVLRDRHCGVSAAPAQSAAFNELSECRRDEFPAREIGNCRRFGFRHYPGYGPAMIGHEDLTVLSRPPHPLTRPGVEFPNCDRFHVSHRDTMAKTCKLDYHGGERYAQLERDPAKPDLLGEILKPLTPEP